MSLILHIDTALEKAFVGLAEDGKLLLGIENSIQQDHAKFVQPAIQQILQQLQLNPLSIDAVGVTKGPGSYTGLRVGMSSAKGLCYALNKPLLAINTLELLTDAAIENFPGFDIYCPMIDARRKEVFTALYNESVETAQLPLALILDQQSFYKELQKNRILFFGNGSEKWKLITENSPNAFFENVQYNGKHLSSLFFNCFKNRQFCNLAYEEPLYVKDFHFAAPHKNA